MCDECDSGISEAELMDRLKEAMDERDHWRSEAEWRKNNMEQSGLWPSTVIESDELMPDGKPRKLAVVPNWCIEKIKRDA